MFPLLAIASLLILLAGTSHTCPAGQYPSEQLTPPVICHACPEHTTTFGDPGTASSVHDCKCQAGFLCMYYRQVHATVTLNTTLSDFESDHRGVRSSFLSGVAAAAGVSSEKVHVHFVVIRLNHRRRLRTLGLLDCIQVSIVVSGTSTEDSLQNLHQHLSSMHMTANSWEVRRRVLVLAVPTGGI